jgi:hypothetical protein
MAEPHTSQHMWKGSIIPSVVLLDISARLYTVKGGPVLLLLLLYNHISEKDQRIQFKKAAAASSQPKSIVDNVSLVVVVMVIQNK